MKAHISDKKWTKEKNQLRKTELCLLPFPICISLWKNFKLILNVFLFLPISTRIILQFKSLLSHHRHPLQESLMGFCVAIPVLPWSIIHRQKTLWSMQIKSYHSVPKTFCWFLIIAYVIWQFVRLLFIKKLVFHSSWHRALGYIAWSVLQLWVEKLGVNMTESDPEGIHMVLRIQGTIHHVLSLLNNHPEQAWKSSGEHGRTGISLCLWVTSWGPFSVLEPLPDYYKCGATKFVCHSH